MATNSSVLLEFPFKAIGIIKNENDPTHKDAFIFEDDNSIVNIDMCEVIFN